MKKKLIITLAFSMLLSGNAFALDSSLVPVEKTPKASVVEDYENTWETTFIDDLSVAPPEINTGKASVVEDYENTWETLYYDDLIQSNARGDSKPTKGKDLSKGSYTGTFGSKVYDVYTNYYFNTNSSGEIYLDLSSVSSGLDYIKITCYKVGKSSSVSSWSGDHTKNKKIKFDELDTEANYYFRLQSKNITDYLSGSIEFYH